MSQCKTPLSLSALTKTKVFRNPKLASLLVRGQQVQPYKKCPVLLINTQLLVRVYVIHRSPGFYPIIQGICLH